MPVTQKVETEQKASIPSFHMVSQAQSVPHFKTSKARNIENILNFV